MPDCIAGPPRENRKSGQSIKRKENINETQQPQSDWGSSSSSGWPSSFPLQSKPRSRFGASAPVNQVLDWNQIFIDTLIATNTANSSSQRLGAIVHTAIFDAYNGVERRYTPIFVHDRAPHGASRRAAVVAAAHTALVGLFPARQPALDASYEARWRR